MRLLLNGTLEHKKKSKLFSNYVNLSAYPFALGEGKSHIDLLSLHIFPFFVSLYAFYIIILFCSFVTEKSGEGFLIFLGGNFLPFALRELRSSQTFNSTAKFTLWLIDFRLCPICIPANNC